jgi:hypothetical protein
MLGIMIALFRNCFLSSTKKEDMPTVDDKPTVDVSERGSGATKSPLRIRTPQGVICSSCPDFKVLEEQPVEVEEWTCDRCVVEGSSCQH